MGASIAGEKTRKKKATKKSAHKKQMLGNRPQGGTLSQKRTPQKKKPKEAFTAASLTVMPCNWAANPFIPKDRERKGETGKLQRIGRTGT